MHKEKVVKPGDLIESDSEDDRIAASRKRKSNDESGGPLAKSAGANQPAISSAGLLRTPKIAGPPFKNRSRAA